MAKNAIQARKRVVDAIGKVVMAAQELSQAEAEYLGSRRAHKNGTVKLVCGFAPDKAEK